MASTERLRTLWQVSLVGGLLGFVGALWWVMSAGGPGLDWVWGVMAFGAAALIYNACFFLLCSIFASRMSEHVEDDTEVEGDTVVHVVRHGETGDATLDFYIKAYATARGTTAVAIVSGIMISIALYFF